MFIRLLGVMVWPRKMIAPILDEIADEYSDRLKSAS